MQVKVHITVTKNSKKAQALLVSLRASCFLSGINEKRFVKYQIITAMVDEESIPVIEKMDGVESVEKDGQKSVL